MPSFKQDCDPEWFDGLNAGFYLYNFPLNIRDNLAYWSNDKIIFEDGNTYFVEQ